MLGQTPLVSLANRADELKCSEFLVPARQLATVTGHEVDSVAQLAVD